MKFSTLYSLAFGVQVCVYIIYAHTSVCRHAQVCACVCVCVWMCACVCVCECIHARVYAGATNDMAFPKSHQNDTLQSHPTSTPFAPEIAPKPNPQITELLVCTLGWMKGGCVCVCVWGGGGWCNTKRQVVPHVRTNCTHSPSHHRQTSKL